MALNLELEKRLQHWAAWIVTFLNGEQGYPRESSIARFFEEGFSPYQNTAKSSSIPYYNPKAETVNTCFNRLKSEYPDRADALYHYYISRKKLSQLASERKIASRTWRSRVRDAKLWMAASLGL